MVVAVVEDSLHKNIFALALLFQAEEVGLTWVLNIWRVDSPVHQQHRYHDELEDNSAQDQHQAWAWNSYKPLVLWLAQDWTHFEPGCCLDIEGTGSCPAAANHPAAVADECNCEVDIQIQIGHFHSQQRVSPQDILQGAYSNPHLIAICCFRSYHESHCC